MMRMEKSPTLSQDTLQGPVRAPLSGGKPKQLIFFFHGVGANGDDLIDIADLIAPELPDAMFLSPNAPNPYDMAPFGFQWFSLMDRRPHALLAGADSVEPTVNQFIDEQIKKYGLDESCVAVIGFSQGTMTALYSLLRREKPVAAIIGFSGALIGDDVLADELRCRPPVCLIHGTMDVVVPYGAMEMAQQSLKFHDVPCEAYSRPGLGHGIDQEGLTIATRFLRERFC